MCEILGHLFRLNWGMRSVIDCIFSKIGTWLDFDLWAISYCISFHTGIVVLLSFSPYCCFLDFLLFIFVGIPSANLSWHLCVVSLCSLLACLSVPLVSICSCSWEPICYPLTWLSWVPFCYQSCLNIEVLGELLSQLWSDTFLPPHEWLIGESMYIGDINYMPQLMHM